MIGRDKRNFARTLALVAVFFTAVAPTLSWSQFSGDSEDLVVQAVLEMRNGGPVWVPNLSGHPRIRKPPLTTWISAAAVSSKTMRDLSSTTPAIREAAYRHLAWEVRWPALVAACLMLLAIAWTADMIGGPAHVIPAVVICGTSLLFLRYVRAATTDVYLALWVSVANACFTAALFQKRRWIGCVGGGLAVGLAVMSKGPAVFVESVLPVFLFWCVGWHGRLAHAFVRKEHRRDAHATNSSSIHSQKSARWALPIAVGIVLMLIVSLAWPISVLIVMPGSWKTWLVDMLGKRTDRVSRDPWFAYWALLPNMIPWLPMFVAGFYIACQKLRRSKKVALALSLVVLPIIALSFLHDRKERYLLPMIGPAAILAAHAAVRLKRAHPLRQKAARVVWNIHWGLLSVLTIGLPLFGGIKLKRLDGGFWYSPTLAILASMAGAGVIAIGLFLQRMRRDSFILTGGAVMLLVNLLLLYGLTASPEGLSEMKPVADRIHADFPAGTVIYYDPPPRVKPVTLDLDIYLDRIVHVTSDLPPSPVYDGVSALIVLRKPDDPEPKFKGWKSHSDLVSRKHHWYVMVRDQKALDGIK